MPVDHEIDSRNKNIQIYINGSFYHRDEAKISVYDSGFLMGDGIWEGLRLVNDKWIFIDEHIDRLFEGCKALPGYFRLPGYPVACRSPESRLQFVTRSPVSLARLQPGYYPVCRTSFSRDLVNIK